MFDMHVTRLLKDRWETRYGASPQQFEALFGGLADDGNWHEVIREWYDKLSRKDYVQFRTAYNLDARPFPQIIVNLEEEPNEYQPLGFDGGVEVGDSGVSQVFTSVLNQTAVIRIYSETSEHTRALHEFVRQTMMSNVSFFGRLGYQGLRYQSGTDLEPEPEAMPELLGIMVRSQRWVTVYEPKVAVAATVQKSVLVRADDVIVGGNPGGVSGTTEITEDQ